MKKAFLSVWRALLLLLVGLAMLAPAPGLAEEPGNPVGFSVRAVLPENQLSDVAYFDLILGPSEEQTVEIEIENHLNEPLTLDIALHDASTNPNGLIRYAPDPDAAVEGARAAQWITSIAGIRLDLLASGDGDAVLSVDGNRIVLAAYATVRVPITISTPKQRIVGQLLGGIVVTRVDADDEGKAAAFAVRSVYNYAIALALQAGDTTGIKPSVILDFASPSSVAGWPSLTVAIRNDEPLIIVNARMTLRVYPQGEADALLQETKERIGMAPHSTLHYALMLPDGMPLPPGDYRLVLEWEYENTTQTMETAFTIT